jgi:hypothetical protein
MMTKRYLKVLVVVLIVTAIGIAVAIDLQRKMEPPFVEVISITSNVRSGDEVTLVAKASPGATVNIASHWRRRIFYAQNPACGEAPQFSSVIDDATKRVAGRDGIVSWTWIYTGEEGKYSDYATISISAEKGDMNAYTEAVLTFHEDSRLPDYGR